MVCCLLGLILNSKECLIGDGKMGSSLGFSDKTRPQESLTQETRVKECWKEGFPLAKEGWVREQLGMSDIHKSNGPDGIHPGCCESQRTP